jgi:hypothetical protein
MEISVYEGREDPERRRAIKATRGAKNRAARKTRRA